MASYLRPRRGKKSTAESQALVLKRGEVFFECPDTGVGTGAGKLKVGDGSTAYSSLPYFMEATNVENSTIGFTDSSTATDSSNNPTYLTNIKPANSLKTIFTNLKQLLYNYNSQLTSLNNDKLDVMFSLRATLTSTVKTKTFNDFICGFVCSNPTTTSLYIGYKSGSVLTPIINNNFTQITFSMPDTDTLTMTSNTNYSMHIYALKMSPYYTQV